MLQIAATLKNNLFASFFKTKLLIYPRVPANQKKSDSFPQSSGILYVVEKYQIGSDTSQSAQIFSGLSELQSCFYKGPPPQC